MSERERLLLGLWRTMVPIPPGVWQAVVAQEEQRGGSRLDFMSEDHHRVRDYAVLELPRWGHPIPPERFAQDLHLPLDRVGEVLDELQKGMTFLYRNEAGAVHWAYPVTVDRTPHHITFSTGEQVYAAWAIDAVATPFVQGHLRGQELSSVIRTECAHCGQPIRIEIDSDLNILSVEEGASPLVFFPLVDFSKLEDPSIIDAFWTNSVFFWSEEHARSYRTRQRRGQRGRMRGPYMTIAQAAYVTPILQGALFGFPRSG